MNTVQLYIEENLDASRQDELRKMLMNLPHVADVEISINSPHEFVVEYEEHQNMPMKIIEALKSKGYHPDIFSG